MNPSHASAPRRAANRAATTRDAAARAAATAVGAPSPSAADGPAPAPGGSETAGWDTVQDSVAADLRRAVIDRMAQMNALHAANAWELRRRDPIAPHALAFLFAQPDERPGRAGRFRLTAATKLWLAGETELDLPERLFRYRLSVSPALAAPGADVRDLANKRDPRMAADAIYVGLGVSSLDTPTGAWAEVVATARLTRMTPADPAVNPAAGRANARAEARAEARISAEHDLPGTVRAVLTDATIICLERRGMPEFNHRLVHATKTLDYTSYESPYPWIRTDRDNLAAETAHAEILPQMDALNDLCWQTDEARLAHRRRP